METLVITRVIFSILLIPLLMILGVIVLVVLTFLALTISPFLALAAISAGMAGLYGVARWESRRVSKEMPRDDR